MTRRFRSGGLLGLAIGLCMASTGCLSPVVSRDSLAAVSAPPAKFAPSSAATFSPERAWLHLESIVRRGPRPAGGEEAAAVRTYLRNRLRASGFQVEIVEHALDAPFPGPGEQEGAQGLAPGRLVKSLVARLPGPSEDLVLVAAPYTSPERGGIPLPGANAGGSGAAVALELARALAEGPRHYSYLFVFVAGDGVGAAPLEGSREVALHLARSGALARARAGLFLDRVGDAELLVRRDLHSSAPYRDIVWEQAEAHGYGGAFASEGFAELVAGHRAFGSAGLRQMVALVAPVSDGAGDVTGSSEDALANCSSESLAAVGRVSLGSLRAIETRLDRMDRYAASPAPTIARDARDREAASIDSLPVRESLGTSRDEGASP